MIRLFFLALFLPYLLVAKQIDIQLNASKAILINAKTGAVLFEKNADEPTYPASTTKIATALYVCEVCKDRLEELAVVKKEAVASITPQAKRESNYRCPAHWLETDGTHIGLKAGEQLRILDLLYGAMLSSGNDACNTLAIHCSGTVPKFMQELNQFMQKIGCRQTHFLNPHGLHHPEHVTTARDLAHMAQWGMQIPLFREIVGTARYVCPRSNLEEERTFVQTNLFLRKGSYFDPRVIGVKTGVTKTAGSALVAAARVDDRELISVILGAHSRAEVLQETKKLFDAAFAEPRLRQVVLEVGETSLTHSVKGARGKLKTYLTQALHHDFYPSEEEPIKAMVSWKIPNLPIKKGQQVAIASIVNSHGVVLEQAPLFALNDLKRSAWILIFLVPLCGFFIFWLAKRARQF